MMEGIDTSGNSRPQKRAGNKKLALGNLPQGELFYGSWIDPRSVVALGHPPVKPSGKSTSSANTEIIQDSPPFA